MNKKHYTTLKMEIINTSGMHLLAGSGGVDANNNIVIEDPQPGDGGSAAGRDFDIDDSFDFDDFKQWLLVLVFSITSLFASAQVPTITKQPADAPDDGKKHAMTIYYSENDKVIYDDIKQIEHVTYLPGVGLKVYIAGESESHDYLYSQLLKIEYTPDDNANANWKKEGIGNMWENYPEAWRLEYPQLNDRVSTTGNATNCQVIVKSCDPYGITYSLEWDNQLVANRWTCYELHAGNTMSNVSRKDDFKADGDAFNSSILEDYSGSGFSRGHLCPSADRVCSREQNKQTFFLTNMQPQYQNHNAGIWSRLETLVRNYATDDSYSGSHCDTLYVVKAATITNKVTIDDTEVDGVYAERCVGGEGHTHELLVPKYFYMALLHYNKATDTYRAVGFWTNHTSETGSGILLGDCAISIKELEKRTGIDFFCNLPDDVETTVESEEPDMSFWKLTKTTP